MKKNILIISSIFPPEIGGPATYTENIAQELSKKHNITVLSSYLNKKLKNNNKYNFRHIQFKGLKFLRPFQLIFYTIKNIKKFNTLFCITSPQDTFLTILICKLLNKKIILRIGGAYHLEIFFSTGKKNLSTKMKSKIIKLLLKYIIPICKKNIYVSPSIKMYLKKYNLYSNNCNLIFNPINLKSNNINHPNKFNNINLFTVSRIIKVKNIEEIILCIKQNPRIKFFIIGDGPHKTFLKKLIKSNNMKKQVFFLGVLSKHQLLQIYPKMHYFILNSFFEGCPNILNEILNYNIPILTNKFISKSKIVNYNNAFIYNNIKEILPYISLNSNIYNYKKLVEKSNITNYCSMKDHILKLTKIL